jgi:hypothetical protein
VLRALELFGPQARPYNFDNCFDGWGLVRKIFDWLDDGYQIDDELGEAGDAREARWRRIAGPGDLVPGDLLATHPHADLDFHTVFYCGRVGADELVYDSSPRSFVPLYDESYDRVDARQIFTRYMRATETTDRLRDGGGAYLRLWDDRQRYVNKTFHDRLVAGGAAAPCPSTARSRCPRTRAAASCTTIFRRAVWTTTCLTEHRCLTTTMSRL